MKTSVVSPADLKGVFAVPPLARRHDPSRSLDFAQNERITRHLLEGGVTRLMYGGNAFLYHISLADYAALLDWLSGLPDDFWAIPSAGPSYGRAVDQALLLRKYAFPCVMMLPCGDPRDAAGLEQGLREFADAAEKRLILYLKEEKNFGADKDAGLDVVARLVHDGICVAIKYAVVLEDPNQDPYLRSLLRRVDRKYVISGMGERPAIQHLRDWGLPGFTTGSGCIAPRLSNTILELCAEGNYEDAEKVRARFMPTEDLRDAWGPARVLHQAVESAEISSCGPLIPYQSALSGEQAQQLKVVAQELYRQNQSAAAGHTHTLSAI
jgi:dihydrodipicolinate synthase/N-acetylneuraminate lyase